MNSYRSTNEVSAAPGSLPGLPAYSAPNPYEDPRNPSLTVSQQSLPVLQVGLTPLTRVLQSDDSGDQSDPRVSQRTRLQSSQAPVPHQQAPVSSQMSNPYPALATPTSFQLSMVIPSPDLQAAPSPTPPCSEDSCPNLECCICFCQFNNVFRCPKMLQCKHTFCLECLARMNVKSAEPSAIQCPLCRSLTPLPALGLPKLDTDSAVVSYLPAAMQRVYSIRFVRNKGKLQVKRSSGDHQRWGPRPRLSISHSVDVGLPSPTLVNPGSEAGGVRGALLRLSSRPGCRDVLLASVVVMLLVLLTVIIIIFVLAFRQNPT